MARNYHPRNRCGRGCLLAPPTVRTPPAGTFPLVSANVPSRIMVVSNYYEHFPSIELARFGHGSRRGIVRTIMEQLETESCLLVRPTYQATSHHAAAAACLSFKRPCASRRDTPHERARARDEHHSPAMSTAHTFHARDGARDHERAGFRVSGLCRRRVVGGVFGSSTEEANDGRHRGRK